VLHQAGMVHGDLKPANVIVSDDGRPHLIDFGLVRHEGQSFGSSGTLPYLAPEILHGRAEDRRADLYSLGITLYRLLTNKLPRRTASVSELSSWHLRRGPLVVSALREVPPVVDRIVQRLTDPDPELRFPTAGEVALALDEVSRSGPRPRLHFVPPAPGASLLEPVRQLEALVRARLLPDVGGGQTASSAVVLQGEIGAGKSTLLQELAWRCQLEEIEVLRAEFRLGDRRAFGAWQELLTQVAGVTSAPHPIQQSSMQDTEPFGLFQRISTYLARSARRLPLLLLLDGLEQADEESRALLRYLAHTLTAEDAVILVAAHRPDEGLARQLGALPHVNLDPLTIDDVGRMVAEAGGLRDPDLTVRLHEMTAGNPMFVVEALEQLVGEGWPAHPELERLLPPLGIEQLHTRRLRALDPSQLSLLEVLAATGRPVEEALIRAVVEACGEEGRDVPAGLEALRQREWLELRPDGTHSFQRGHVPRVVYQQIPPRRRQVLHEAITLVLREGDADLVDLVEQTHHSIKALRADLALQTLDGALSRLQQLGAHRGAIELLEALAPLLERNPSALLRVRREIGALCLLVGDYGRAKQELTLTLLEAKGPELQQARIRLARAHRLTGEAEQALELLRQVEQDDAEPADRLAALAELAETLVTLEAHDQTLLTVQRALETQGGTEPAVRAELRGQAALALGALGRFDEAEQQWELALADAGGDLHAEANVLNRWAITAYRQGEVGLVPGRYRSALERAHRCGDVERMAAIQFNLASFHLFKGELAAALEHMPPCVQLFEAMGMQRNLSTGYSCLGHLQRELGLYEQARISLERAIFGARELGQRSVEAYASLNLGLVQMERGETREARRWLEAACQLQEQPMETADALLDLARLELAEGKVEQALQAIARARRQVEGELRPDLLVVASLLAVRATIGTLAEAFEWAEAEIRQALARACDMGSRQLVWQCHAAAMELEQARGDEDAARQQALAALRTLEQMACDLPAEVRLSFWQDRQRRAIRRQASGQSDEDQSPLAEIATLVDLCDSPDTTRDPDCSRPPITTMMDTLLQTGQPRRR